MSSLRSQVIRLAHSNPRLRAYLLPMLKQAGPADDTIRLGDLVMVKTSRGEVEATVVHARPMRTGNLELRFTTVDGRDLKFTAKATTYSGNARVLRLIRRQGAADVAELSQGAAERQQNREEAREDFADKGRAALKKFDPRPGDTVTIEYRGGIRRMETVNGVNWKTGKVGVVKETHRTPAEQEQMRLMFWIMNRETGSNVRPPQERDTRWIPAQQIVDVERMTKPEGA